MIKRDDYIMAVIEELQDDLFVMDKEEIWDVLQHILELMNNDTVIEE